MAAPGGAPPKQTNTTSDADDGCTTPKRHNKCTIAATLSVKLASHRCHAPGIRIAMSKQAPTSTTSSRCTADTIINPRKELHLFRLPPTVVHQSSVDEPPGKRAHDHTTARPLDHTATLMNPREQPTGAE